jgi:hypothetical protein
VELPGRERGRGLGAEGFERAAHIDDTEDRDFEGFGLAPVCIGEAEQVVELVVDQPVEPSSERGIEGRVRAGGCRSRPTAYERVYARGVTVPP